MGPVAIVNVSVVSFQLPVNIYTGTASGLPRQTSLQTPMITNTSASSDRPPEYLPPMSSPPPPYQEAMGKVSTFRQGSRIQDL